MPRPSIDFLGAIRRLQVNTGPSVAKAPVATDGRGPGAWLSSLRISDIVMLAGIASLLVPTLLTLAKWSWSSESGAHGPIVMATGLWLIWRDRGLLRNAVPQPLFPASLLLAVLLPLYAVGRIIGVLMIESLSLYLVLLVLAYLKLGGAVLRRFWFAGIYMLFLITPPENWIFVATRPIKMWLSTFAVDVLSFLGYSVGSTGVMIQIDGYQLLVATACSGINSLIGICALSLFYVYLRHGTQPRYAALLISLVLPLAIAANVLRILILVLITHSFGEAAGQGIAHDLAGLGMFLLSVTLLIGIDAALYPLFRRMGWARL